MQADLRIADPLAVIRLTGELDAVAVEDVAGLVTTALRSSAVTGLVVDVSAVTFCDSMGLSILIAAHNACSDADRSFTLRGPTPSLRRLLHITGLTETFTIDPETAPSSED